MLTGPVSLERDGIAPKGSVLEKLICHAPANTTASPLALLCPQFDEAFFIFGVESYPFDFS